MLRYLATLVLLFALVTCVPRTPESRYRERGQNPYLQGYSRHAPRQLRNVVPKPPNSKALDDYLLPSSTVPISYDLHLIPYLATPVEKNFTFDGEVNIRISAAQATNTIVMHAWELAVTSVQVVKVSDLSLIAVTSYDILSDDRHFFTLNLASSLQFNQEYIVKVVYTGVLNDEIYGFFRSTYVDENGNTDWLAITDLEPAGARRFMPCYDQPNLKARVTLHMAREPGHTVLANMPVERDDGEPVEGLAGWEWVHFQQSPPMATYLICFSTNKFSSVTSLADVRYKVWARPATVQYGQYTTEITPDIIRYFELFTGVPYQLPKYDQIGMVEFFSGAMENWGLVTYLEPYVLYNSAVDHSWDKLLMAQVVVHETAHQWFGDLVSPKWWSSLWLNEGFATYFEYWGTTLIGPDWQMDQQFVVDMMYSAFRADIGSHPIYADVDSPDSIFGIFDSITYNKGGCLVRFMVNFLGEENFKTGIKNYLTAMGYNSAEQNDLFFHLGSLAPPMPNGVTFKSIMDTWTLQAGFPLVTVTRNYADNTATITQRVYGTAGTEKWIIPLTYTSGANPNFSDLSAKAWLLPTDTNIIIQAPGLTDWLLLNLKQVGFYRVNYDVSNWNLIASYMSTPGNAITIDPINRAQLMDDSMTFAEAGILEYVTALTMTKYLDQETELVPWTVATDNLEYIRDRVYGTQEGVDLFQDYMRRKMNFVYNSINGFSVSESDAFSTVLNRWTITRWACNVEHTACNTQGSALFQQWLATSDPDNNNPVDLDLRTPAYCAGQRRGAQAEYDFLLARYTSATNGDEAGRLIDAMGCASDTALLQAYLQESLSTAIIRPGNALDVLQAVYSHPRGVDLALDFLVTNWRALNSLYGAVGYGFRSIATKLNTQAHFDTVSQFRDANSGELGATNNALLSTTLNTIQRHMDWNADHLASVMDFFRQN